ncbi:hypothetical protein TrRE_jg8838 [Triparma retinervis]|uniref:Uncharacterized protein n=1 Tax=Triparma retinervis TaxID=2557542 RepID=A0A9W6Z1S6_9STRA|nr:hypothetical protein TrRE_jg8838 [Triparma retinervis]
MKQSDIVSYYTLDGGSKTGQVNVGVAISAFLSGPNSSTWTVEVRPLSDYSSSSRPGYYKELGGRNRGRNDIVEMGELRREVGSYVRSVDAFKVAVDREGLPLGLKEGRAYDVEGFEGMVRPEARAGVDREVLEEDGRRYRDLKRRIFLDALSLGGAVGLAVGAFDGELARDYFAGLVSGIGYIGLLSLKADGLGGPGPEGGGLRKSIPNLRFLAPAVALGYVAANNAAHGTMVEQGNALRTVTTGQFAATVGGFLTYRLPIVVREVGGVVGEELGLKGVLPGSVAVALELGKEGWEKGEEGAGEAKERENVVVVVSGARGFVDEGIVNEAVGRAGGNAFRPRFARRGEEGWLEGGMVGETMEGGWRKDEMDREGVKVVVADVEGVESLRREFEGVIVGVWCSDTSLDKIRERVEDNCLRRGEEVPKDEVLAMITNLDFKSSLGFYAAYHQDPYNQLIHFIFIPLIWWSINVWMCYVPLPVLGTSTGLTYGTVMLLMYGFYYVALDRFTGGIFTAVLCLFHLQARAAVNGERGGRSPVKGNKKGKKGGMSWGWFAFWVHAAGWAMQIGPAPPVYEATNKLAKSFEERAQILKVTLDTRFIREFPKSSF